MFSLAGFVFLIFAVLLPFVSPRIRQNAALTRAIVIVLLIRQVVTLVHIVFGPLPTIDGDPIAFNAYAMATDEVEFGGSGYTHFLRLLYSTLGGSHLLGCEVSQIGFSLSLIALVELLYLIGSYAQAPRLVFLYGLLPSVALNTSAVLREGLQMAGFLALTYGVLHIRRRGLHAGSAIVPAAFILLTSLHNGFAPYLLLVLPVALLWAVGSRPSLLILAGAVGMFFIAFFGGTFISRLQEKSVVLQSVSEGNALEYVGGYQERVNVGRSAFDTTLDVSSLEQLISTGPVVAGQYLFAPFPWQVRGTIDLYGMFESLLRFLLFLAALRAIYRAEGAKRMELAFLLYMFLSMELVWAAGTANWGTAFRHRVVAWGLLVTLGGPSLVGGKKSAAAPVAATERPEVQSIRGRRRELARKRQEKHSAPLNRGRRIGGRRV